MKKTLLALSLLVLLSSSILVTAESPALLQTTMVKGGLGITAKIKNIGNMTATNISCGCLVVGLLIERTTFVPKAVPKMVPNKEVTLHFFFFFVGRINITVGAFDYFDGVQHENNTLKTYDAFAFGPFIKLVETRFT
jgi:hypothetical protein